MTTANKKRIALGSGKLYFKPYNEEPITDVSALITELQVEENLLGLIQGGASVEYTPTFYNAKDDLGLAQKTIITEEDATLKSGIMVFNGNTLSVLTATSKVEETEKMRIVKIGGIGKNDGQKYILLFHHEDKTDGDIWLLIVGNNQSGITLSFAKDKETVINAEFKAHPSDSEGTLIYYVEELKGATGAMTE